MTDIVERWRVITSRPHLIIRKEREVGNQMADEIARLRAEVADWRECAKFDVLMEGPKAMGWNRSALERCRERYIG
jgi:hypothetical protein